MKYVYLSLLIIFLVICLAFATEFEVVYGSDFDNEHDESIHDVDGEEPTGAYYDAASKFFSSLTKDAVQNHFKDIIRGFSDKGFEDCDINQDKFLDVTEVECFVTEKMGFAMIAPAAQVMEYYDKDADSKLNSDEVWHIVEDKNPKFFEILQSTVERNMELIHGAQGGKPSGPGAGIFY